MKLCHRGASAALHAQSKAATRMRTRSSKDSPRRADVCRAAALHPTETRISVARCSAVMIFAHCCRWEWVDAAAAGRGRSRPRARQPPAVLFRGRRHPTRTYLSLRPSQLPLQLHSGQQRAATAAASCYCFHFWFSLALLSGFASFLRLAFVMTDVHPMKAGMWEKSKQVGLWIGSFAAASH